METETELPRYRLIQPFYADDNYIAAESEIYFSGIPNESMEPLNPPAREAMRKFLDGLGPLRRTPALADVAEQAMRDRPREVSFPRLDKDVPLTGVKHGPNGVAAAAVAKAPTVKVEPPPPAGRFKPPVKVMGTVVSETPTPGSIQG